MAYNWPKDTLAAKIAFYGDPRGANGESPTWRKRVETRIIPPWQMSYAGKPIKSIAIHAKCAKALSEALAAIRARFSDRDIARYHLYEFGGTFAYRLIRGSATNLSNHSWGIAIDLAPSLNELGDVRFGDEPNEFPLGVVKCFADVGARWGGNYHGRRDPMHFEFVSPA